MNGSQLRFRNAIGPAKVKGNGSFSAGAFRLLSLGLLEDGVDFLLR
jgi:hypothetical protein